MSSTNCIFGVLKGWESESVFTMVCARNTRPGRSHPEVRLHNFFCRSPLELNVNPED